jgi:hypothetical protein
MLRPFSTYDFKLDLVLITELFLQYRRNGTAMPLLKDFLKLFVIFAFFILNVVAYLIWTSFLDNQVAKV